MNMLFVLAGASGFADPYLTALTVFLMAAFAGARLFSDATSHTLAARLGLLVGLAGAGTLGAIVVAGSSLGMFGRIAGVLAVAFASAAGVGGFLISHGLLEGNDQPGE